MKVTKLITPSYIWLHSNTGARGASCHTLQKRQALFSVNFEEQIIFKLNLKAPINIKPFGFLNIRFFYTTTNKANSFLNLLKNGV